MVSKYTCAHIKKYKDQLYLIVEELVRRVNRLLNVPPLDVIGIVENEDF